MLNSFATTQVMISEVVLKIDSVDSMNISPRLIDAQNKKMRIHVNFVFILIVHQCRQEENYEQYKYECWNGLVSGYLGLVLYCYGVNNKLFKTAYRFCPLVINYYL